MKTIYSIVLLFSVTFFTAQHVSAQMLTEEKIRSIERLANIICNGIHDSGSSSMVSIDAEVEAEAKAILRLLVGVGGNLDVDAFFSQYQGVPRSDLAAHLQSAQDCRLHIFQSSRQEVTKTLNSISPQEDKLVWTFPHVVRDGVALGVINVRPHGSGVDVNYRLRNVREEAIYVKFHDMSYTDESGNVCQRGSLTTSISGISYRKNDPEERLGSGDSIQFSGNNIRCDGRNFGSTGDILASITVGKSKGKANIVQYEISNVTLIK